MRFVSIWSWVRSPQGALLCSSTKSRSPHGRSSEMWARPRAALCTPRPLETSRLQGQGLCWLFPTEILRLGPARRHVLPQSVDLPWTGLSDFPCTVHRLSKGKVAQLQVLSAKKCLTGICISGKFPVSASLAQLVEHALRKRMVVGSIPTGGLATAGDADTGPGLNSCSWWPMLGDFDSAGICCAR